MRIVRALIALSLAGVEVLTACTGMPGPSPSASQSSTRLASALLSADYPIETTRTGKAQLRNGLFSEPAAPGSATMTVVRLGEQQAYGDLNGDGVEDVAVTLVTDPGGSGLFVYLSAVINTDGTARPVATVLLGDRVRVTNLTIKSGRIVVKMLTRRPNEPMSAVPTLAVTRSYRLKDGELAYGGSD